MIKVKDKKFTNVKSNSVRNEEFYKSEAKTYGLNSIQEIIGYASRYNIDLVSACREFGYTDEQIDLLKLVYARELYKDGLIKQGNVILNNVESSPNKTEFVNDTLDEIRKRKEFYQYRPVEKPNVLQLVRPGRRNR